MLFSKAKSLLRDILLIPLTVGYAKKAEDLTYHRNGGISSLVLGTTVVAVTTVLMIIAHTNERLTMKKAEGTIRITSVLVLTIGISSIFIVIVHGRPKGRAIFQWGQKTTLWRTKLCFLWLFMAGFLLQTFLYTIDTIRTRKTDFSEFLWVVRLIWNFLLTVFILMQSVFISLSHYLWVIDNINLQYGMTLQLAVNAIIWITAIIEETPEFHPNTNRGNATGNKTATSSLSDIIENDIKPYTLPMVIEYTLLSVFFILSFFMSKNSKEVNELGVKYSREMAQNEDERRPLLKRDTTSKERRKLPWSYIVCALSCLTMISVEIYVSSSETNYLVDLTFFQAMQLINLSLLMVLNVRLLILCTKLETNATAHAHGAETSNRKFVLLLSCLGHEMYDVFGAFGLIVRDINDATFLVTLTIAKHCVSFMATVYQTILILKLKEEQNTTTTIRRLILLVSVINFSFWFGDCFIMKRERSLTYVENVVYGKEYWNFIVDVLFPVTIFYRFHCAMEFYEFFTKHYIDSG